MRINCGLVVALDVGRVLLSSEVIGAQGSKQEMSLLQRVGLRCRAHVSGNANGFLWAHHIKSLSTLSTPQANSSDVRKKLAIPSLEEVQARIRFEEAKARKDKQTAPNKNMEHMQIRAVHIARKMDIVQLFQKLYTDRFKVSHYLFRDSLVLKLSGAHESTTMVTGMVQPPAELGKEPVEDPLDLDLEAELEESLPSSVLNERTLQRNIKNSRRAKDKWVVYFDYGAVVFFNCDQQLIAKLVNHAERFCTNVFEQRGHDEELLLVSNPVAEKWSNLHDNNSLVVKEIDLVNVHVIAGVLAQTVALEHFERQIESILTEFEKLNTAVERHGPRQALFGIGLSAKVSETERNKKLFKIVATSNTLLIDLVNKLRVIDRKRPGDAAWIETRYHELWEMLFEEFELKARFDNLEFKTDMIQQNTKFFLEVLGTHKGERLEWYIIILISIELGITLVEKLV